MPFCPYSQHPPKKQGEALPRLAPFYEGILLFVETIQSSLIYINDILQTHGIEFG